MIIEKLGWYKTRRCHNVKVVHICKNKSSVMVIDPENDDYVTSRTENGSVYSHQTDDNDLIKYLGAEEPNKPRKFEFEAYLGEDENKHSSSFYALENALGHITTFFCTEESVKLYNLFTSIEWPKISKWKVTMEEIPCETENT